MKEWGYQQIRNLIEDFLGDYIDSGNYPTEEEFEEKVGFLRKRLKKNDELDLLTRMCKHYMKDTENLTWEVNGIRAGKDLT